MEKSDAFAARDILRKIYECEKNIETIEKINSYDIHISGTDSYIRAELPSKVREQIKKFALDSYRERLEELEKQLSDL